MPCEIPLHLPPADIPDHPDRHFALQTTHCAGQLKIPCFSVDSVANDLFT
jgi:hypothetical protein